jgi:hypothetical protein
MIGTVLCPVCQLAQKRFSSDLNMRIAETLFRLEEQFDGSNLPEDCMMSEDCDCCDCSYERARQDLERRELAVEEGRLERIRVLATLPMYK